jgi:hypothetical protein
VVGSNGYTKGFAGNLVSLVYLGVICNNNPLEMGSGLVENEKEILLVHDIGDVVDDQRAHVAARHQLHDAILDATA